MVPMKKIIIFIIVVVILGGLVWRFNSDSSSNKAVDRDSKSTTTDAVKISNTVVVSNKLSEYKNEELGFSIKYPTTWEKTDSLNNVNFYIAADPTKVNTIGNLQVKVEVISGKCAFPPVTTVKERDTLVVGDLSFSMISISNTVQTRNFFNRMYSLQKGSVCYYFTYSAINTAPSAKGLTAADAQKAASNNTIITDQTDTQFKDMVKSFKFIVGPVGEDEAKIAPKK